MKAICITSRPNLGELDKCLELKDLPLPEPGKNEIRIKVIASTINFDDVHLAEGTMFGGIPLGPKPSQNNPYIPGTDVAGIVDAVGQGVKSFKVGQKVYGICNSTKGRGPWAEYCTTRSDLIAVKPKIWSFSEAAACASSGAVVVSMVTAAKESKNFLGVIEKMGEPAKFGVEMTKDPKKAVESFLAECGLDIKDYIQFGVKLDIEPFYCIVEAQKM